MKVEGVGVENHQRCSTFEHRVHAVRRSKLFCDMPDFLIRHVATHAIERRLASGEPLFLRSDAQDFVAVIITGNIYTTVYGPNGKELIINNFSTDESVGEAAFIEGKFREMNALAGSSTQVLILRRHHFPLLINEPIFLNRLLGLLCFRLREVAALIESMCLYHLESRLARYFVTAVDTHGCREREGVRIPMPPSQSILAAMVNASRPKLNAQLQLWRRSGLVRWTQDYMWIMDIDQLRGMAYIRAL